MEVLEETGRACKVYIHDAKLVYPADEWILYYPDVNTFVHAPKYVAHPNLIKDLNWELNPKKCLCSNK